MNKSYTLINLIVDLCILTLILSLPLSLLTALMTCCVFTVLCFVVFKAMKLVEHRARFVQLNYWKTVS